mmetsp:Transcript_10419/g.26976  ORF Transcript_10419/g.26976 Transcript_10419/m.26976 type:complete len:199 (-) Transcript_10419:370-966(-)
MAFTRNARRGQRALALAVALAATFTLAHLSVSFVAPPRSVAAPTRCTPQSSSPSSARQPALATEPATSVAAPLAVAAGLLALPEASHAMGWEAAVVGPLGLINTGLNAYKFCLGIYALMSWLFAFGILEQGNEIVQKVQGALSSIIDPVLNPLRAIIPSLGGFDISFMVLWFVLEQAQVAAVGIAMGVLTWNAVDTYY